MGKLLFGLALLTFGAFALAENGAGPEKGQVYLSGGGVFYSSPNDIGLDDSAFGPGVGLGIGLTDRWAAELLYSHFDVDLEFLGASGDDTTELIWLDLLYQFGGSDKLQPFVLAGGGKTESDRGALPSFDDTQFNIGIGVFRSLSDRIALRGDVRAVYSEEEDDIQPFAFVGLTAFLGDVSAPPPPDTDGDGVADPNDRCPNSPPGVTVGSDGCEIDSDGDGVADSKDQCPDTPRGASVNANGCALDSDGDGVPDYKDECPDSAAGAKVDERGCYIELEETVTIDLNLEFDTNSADLRADHSAEIQRAVDFLRQYPTANAVIEGHTDSSGAADYNQALSERRAASVRSYLVESAGVGAERLTSVGYGEARPKDSNDTREGMQRNRRVSVVVSGTQTVRQ